MPGDSVWQDSSFVNMTCSDLEQIVPETNLAGRDKLCKFLSQGVYSGPCSLEACCFCGGGQYEYEPRCENMKWNAMQDAGIEFNCEFIDEDVSDKDAFCANFGEETFTADGLALKDAVSCPTCAVNVLIPYTILMLKLYRLSSAALVEVDSASTTTFQLSVGGIFSNRKALLQRLQKLQRLYFQMENQLLTLISLTKFKHWLEGFQT